LIAAAGAVALGLATAAFAEPVAYRATVVTDVRLGQHVYHNAALKLRFVGDSTDMKPATDSSGNVIPSQFCNPPAFFWITKGQASFSFQSGRKAIAGHFLPGQIFVALDTCNGGMGFGSFIGPNGMEPAYPLGFAHGSAENAAFSATALSTAVNTSGNAWSCIGFPPSFNGTESTCASPDPYPLHTDLGQDFFVYMPYTFLCGDGSNNICLQYSGSMNRGTFSVVPGISE
jgi:hypothetical protein